MPTITNEEYLLFKEYLLENCGIEIPEDKIYLFHTRLNDFFQSGEFKSFYDLYTHLTKSNNEKFKKQIIEVMTTNETGFFRDNHPFDTLKNYILPELYTQYKKTKSFDLPFTLKIWSAGCSTGQEPYSIAITIREWIAIQNLILNENIKIIATDISEKVLEQAKKGKYHDSDIAKGMKTEFLNKYIQKKEDAWEITDNIKKMINFNILNLSENFVTDNFKCDVIFCRNVIIYFSKEIKKKIFDNFYSILNKGGYLIVGAVENLYGYNENFETIHVGPTTLYKVKK